MKVFSCISKVYHAVALIVFDYLRLVWHQAKVPLHMETLVDLDQCVYPMLFRELYTESQFPH